MSYYAVFPDNSYREFEELNEAVGSLPEFIIGSRFRGRYDQSFSERRVVDDHFYFDFYKKDGTECNIVKNGWKILFIDDPVRYNTHIHVKISDPQGHIRDFNKWNTDCHYSIRFRNSIDGADGLIELYRYFHKIANSEGWLTLEKEKYENSRPGSLSGLGNLHKYYYDIDTKSQPNLNKTEEEIEFQLHNNFKKQELVIQSRKDAQYFPGPSNHHDCEQDIIDNAFDGDGYADQVITLSGFSNYIILPAIIILEKYTFTSTI